MVRPIVASAEPEREVRAGLEPVGLRRAHRRQPFGREDQRRDQHAEHRGRGAPFGEQHPHHRRQIFGEQHDRDEAGKQQGARNGGALNGRRFGVRVGDTVAIGIGVGVGQEIIAVAHGLDQRKGAVEDQRHDRDKAELAPACSRNRGRST